MGTDSSIPANAPALGRPAELCGYPVVETLTPDATYLAIGPGGRGLTLRRSQRPRPR